MNPKDAFHESWYPLVNLLYQDPLKKLSEEILPNISFQPRKEDIFNVFSMPVKDINVVILGQDPYPNPGDAVGYSFVNGRNKTPKSLQIIEKEIEQETSYSSQGIDTWTEQGVFLLNSALTVETGKAGSHLKYWKEFTKRVVSFIAQENPCIWMFWGKKAQEYRLHIHNNPFYVHGYDIHSIKNVPSNNDWNYILQAPHPAAEAYSGGKAGYYGCNHFLYANEILQKTKSKQITW